MKSEQLVIVMQTFISIFHSLSQNRVQQNINGNEQIK